jgi:hypothetical protein
MQLSRPLLIALIAVVGFAGAWMTVLKKHASTSAAPPPKAPGMTGLGNAVGRAKSAVAESKSSAVTAEKAAGQAPAATAKPAVVHVKAPAPAKAKAPAPKPAPKPAAAPVATTTVLLFAGTGADDAAARQVVRSIHGPHLKTIVASLSQVSKYAPMLGGVQVDASPAIYVIGPDRSAQEIVGLPDRDQVEAAVESVSPRR